MVVVQHAQSTRKTLSSFQVMRTADAWDILLGRPWLKQTRAVVDHGTDTLLLPGMNEVIHIAARSAHRQNPIRAVDLSDLQGERPISDLVTIGDDISADQRRRVIDLLVSKRNALATSLSDLDECPHTTHELRVAPDAKLHKTAFGRPLSEPELKAARDCVRKVLDAGIIERVDPADVKCTAPTVMAKKKPLGTTACVEDIQRRADNALREAGLTPIHHVPPAKPAPCPTVPDRPTEPAAYRMCHNFAAINRATQVKPFPPGDLAAKVRKHAGHRYIIQLDALGAFYWIPVAEQSRPYLCFFVQGYGYLQYKRLLMGATGSPTTYQVAFERTFGELLDPGPISAWMDDVFASSDDFDTLMDTLTELLDKAIASNLRFCPRKTRLFVHSAVLGGTAVSRDGVRPDPEKVAAIVDWPTPMSARDVLSFVNTVAVHRTFIKDFGIIAKPLYDLTCGIRLKGAAKAGALKRSLETTDITDKWHEPQQQAFATLKATLTTFPVCVGPRFDQPFIVTTDASTEGFGGHLQQRDDDGRLRTVAWASRPH
jgi:hypothetical protein